MWTRRESATRRFRQFARRRRAATRLQLPALLALAAVVGGCGGSSQLTHAQLVAKANQACAQATSAAGRLGSPPATYAGLAGYARKLSPIVEKLIGDLRSLNASGNDRQALTNYLTALTAGDHALGLLEKASTPAELNQAVSALDAGAIPTLAGKLGAPKCAASPTSA